MLTTILAYILIVLFSVTEGRLRKGQAAQSFSAGESDRQSTRRLGVAYGIAILLLLFAPFLNILSPGHILYPPVGWIGLAVSLAGYGLRVWANLVLGNFIPVPCKCRQTNPSFNMGLIVSSVIPATWARS